VSGECGATNDVRISLSDSQTQSSYKYCSVRVDIICNKAERQPLLKILKNQVLGTN